MKIKEERNVLIYVNITYKISDNKLTQTFNFSSERKQNLSYIFDSRYLIKAELDNLIKENLLNGFVKRIDYTDKVEMIYNTLEHPQPIIKVINSYIPPYLGCKYCSKAVIKDNFIYCPEKNKHYTLSGIKRCLVFKTKPKLLT